MKKLIANIKILKVKDVGQTADFTIQTEEGVITAMICNCLALENYQFNPQPLMAYGGDYGYIDKTGSHHVAAIIHRYEGHDDLLLKWK